MLLSIMSGLILETANLALLFFLVKRVMGVGRRGWVAPLWIIKFIVLAALVWTALACLKLRPMGFIIGLTLPLIVAIYRPLFSGRGEMKKDGGF